MPDIPMTDINSWLPDQAPNILPPNIWSYVRNFAFTNEGYPEVVDGYQNVFAYNDSEEVRRLAKNGTFIYPWTDFTDDLNLFYVTDDGEVRLVSDVTASNISEVVTHTVTNPTDVAYQWRGTNALGIPIFTNERDYPLQLSLVADTMINLKDWPKYRPGGTTVAVPKLISSFGNFLIAAVGNQLWVSDVIITAGNLPKWDLGETSYTNADDQTITADDASFSQIIDISLWLEGNILNMLELNDTLYIFTDKQIGAITYTGNGEFDGTIVNSSNGIITPRSVTPAPNGFFCLGHNQFYFLNGNLSDQSGETQNLIGEGKFKNTIFEEITDFNRHLVQVIYNRRKHDIWIKTENLIFRYNIQNDTITAMDDHAEIRYIDYSIDGVQTASLTYEALPNWTFDNAPMLTYDDVQAAAIGVFNNRVISIGGSTETPTIFAHDYGPNFNGRAINAVLQRTHWTIGKRTTRENITVQRIIPIFDAVEEGNVEITIGKSMKQQDSPTWRLPKTFNTETSRKVDVNVTSRWLALRISTSLAGFRLLGIDAFVIPHTTNR